MRSRRPSGFVHGLLGLACAAVLGRLAYVFTVGSHVKPGFDTVFYMLTGGILEAGHGYSDPALFYGGMIKPTANFPPLFPLFIAALNRVGIHTFTSYQIAGAICGGTTVVLTGLLGRRVSGRGSVGLVGAALVAASPVVIASDASVMAETLVIPISVAVLLAAAWAASSRSPLRWMVVGGLAGLAALARSEALVLAFVLVPVLVLAAPSRHWRQRLVSISLALLASAGVLAPWLVRNAVTFDPPVLMSTNVGKTAAGANCSSVYYGQDIGLWNVACSTNGLQADAGEGRTNQTLLDRGTHYVSTHYERAVLVVPVRALRAWGLFNPGQQVRWEAVETRSVGWGEIAWPVSIAVLALAIPSLVRLRKRHFDLAIVAGPAVVATGIVALTYGNQRFVLAAVPTLCIAAAMTLVDFWRRRRLPGTAAEERSSAKLLVAGSPGGREPPPTTPDL